MARYMRPASQLIPAEGETDVHYFVKLFEDVDLATVQLQANAYLLLLESGNLPQFALIDTEHGNFQTPAPMPEIRYTIMLTLMWVGGVSGFIPP